MSIVKIEGQPVGGLSVFRSIDLDETEEDACTSTCTLYGFIAGNCHATDLRYVKFYDAAAATVVVGTTTPKLTVPIVAGQNVAFNIPQGIAFSTALCVAATTGVADSDTGAPGANEVLVNVFYKA